MVKLYPHGMYLLNGREISEEAQISKEEARKNTIAYGILKEHNTSSDMEHLQIKFDKLTSQLYQHSWELSKLQEHRDLRHFRFCTR